MVQSRAGAQRLQRRPVGGGELCQYSFVTQQMKDESVMLSLVRHLSRQPEMAGKPSHKAKAGERLDKYSLPHKPSCHSKNRPPLIKPLILEFRLLAVRIIPGLPSSLASYRQIRRILFQERSHTYLHLCRKGQKSLI